MSAPRPDFGRNIEHRERWGDDDGLQDEAYRAATWYNDYDHGTADLFIVLADEIERLQVTSRTRTPLGNSG